MLKGFWSIAEASIAIILIFSFLFAVMPGLEKEEKAQTGTAYKALDQLNASELRRLAEAYDFASIAGNITTAGWSHSVVVCGYSYCAGEMPEGETYAATRISAGYSSYSPRTVKVYVYK
ncbi:MAG: hypothetical protein HYX24_05135 [Candidatus Aenigmarchaeota archaeon]|nr:hypothetical protein [Candidatus Aenigmarchaeota archaeon]